MSIFTISDEELIKIFKKYDVSRQILLACGSKCSSTEYSMLKTRKVNMVSVL